MLWLTALAITALLVGIAPTWTPESLAEETIDLIGVGLILAAVLGRTWCSLYIGGRKKRELVTVGPYSLSRNPLYVFSVLGACGIGMTSGSLMIGALTGLCAFLVLDAVIAHEETYLEDQFGAAYRQYGQSTPRWLSWHAVWQDADQLPVRPQLVLRTLRDTSIMLLAWPAMEGLEWLHMAGQLPVLFQVP